MKKLVLFVLFVCIASSSYALKFKFDKNNRVYIASSLSLEGIENPYFKAYSFFNSPQEHCQFDILEENEDEGKLEVAVQIESPDAAQEHQISCLLKLQVQNTRLHYRVEEVNLTLEGNEITAEKFLMQSILQPKKNAHSLKINDVIKAVLGVVDGIEKAE